MIRNKHCFYRVRKKSFHKFDEEEFQEIENVCNNVEPCKKIDEEKKLGDRELQSQSEKEEQRRETLTKVDIESKKQKILQEERRENFLLKFGESSQICGIRVLCRPFISERWRR